MAWVRIDDGFADHPKVASVGPLGMAYQIAALCYCNKYLTDGYLPASVALRLCHLEGLAEPEDVIARLLDAGMWEETEGGYIIHDYLEYQPSKAQVEASQEQRREAGRKGGQAKAKRAAKQTASETLIVSSSENEAKVCPKPKPKPLISNTPLNPPYGEIVAYLNEKADKNFLPTTKATQRHINARWAEGFRLDDFMAVIDTKVSQWKGTDMDQYLRPATLFGTKFEAYLNERQVVQARASPSRETSVGFDIDAEIARLEAMQGSEAS